MKQSSYVVTKQWIRLLLFFIPLIVFLSACYPKKKILGYFPGGKPKIVRHSRRTNWMNEKVVEYYENGKKKSVKYWLNDLVSYKEISWYENGVKQDEWHRRYKDTVRKTVHDPADSIYTITLKGLVKIYYKYWYENGILEHADYPKGDQQITMWHNILTDSTRRESRKIRPDGYDSITSNTYVKGHTMVGGQ